MARKFEFPTYLSRSHWWASTALIHLLLPCRSASSFQSAHAIEFIGKGQHGVGRQGIELLVTDTRFIDGLYDILLVVQEVVHLEGKCGVLPSLVYREVPNEFVHIGQTLITATRGISDICGYIPRFR